MNEGIQQYAAETFEQLKQHPDLGKYVNPNLPIPSPFQGSGEIKLFILGQDPTVKNLAIHKDIKVVLNLDKAKNLRHYLDRICNGLELSLDENVYATNLLKNFFVRPPTQIKEFDIFGVFKPYWLPVLQAELAQFPDVPVITLGEPLLGMIVTENGNPKVYSYWGYRRQWQQGEQGQKSFLASENNVTGRTVFPFPHQPSLMKQFYRTYLDDYLTYMRSDMEWGL